MAGHPLRSATDRRFGGPLPRQLANQTRIHLIPPEFFTLYHAVPCAYAVLAVISNCYPPVWGRLSTRYSPVRRSVIPNSIRKLHRKCFARLACVRHAASVHPEPGSNSHVKVDSWLRLLSLANCSFPFYLVFVLNFLNSKAKPDLCFLEFSGFYILFNLQFSRNFCCSAFSAATHSSYHRFSSLSTTFFIFFSSPLTGSSKETERCIFSTATLTFYHGCLYLSTTFFILFLSFYTQFHSLSRWNFTITLYERLVKGICAIFLNNFYFLTSTTKYAHFSLLCPYIVSHKKSPDQDYFYLFPAIWAYWIFNTNNFQNIPFTIPPKRIRIKL